MARVKTDWRKRLGHDNLDAILQIAEDGPEIAHSDLDKLVHIWYDSKKRRLSLGCPKYLKQGKRNTGEQNTDIAILTI